MRCISCCPSHGLRIGKESGEATGARRMTGVVVRLSGLVLARDAVLSASLDGLMLGIWVVM